MDGELKKIKIAIGELARAIESGERRGLSEYIGNILGTNETAGVSEPKFRCDCEKCQAVREGENNGEDYVN